MWDDVIIGKGNKGTTAIHMNGIEGNHSILQNSVSFWINNCIFNTSITIYKNTNEGKQLIELIENKSDLQRIMRFINKVILENISMDLLEEKIKENNDFYFNLGKSEKIKEIKNILNII